MSSEDNTQQYSHYDTTIQLMSPSKMLVESATMIFIIAFMLASFIVLQGLFGLFITKYGNILHFFFVEVYISQEIPFFHIYDIVNVI